MVEKLVVHLHSKLVIIEDEGDVKSPLFILKNESRKSKRVVE
jgi:hypothetical protein